MVKKPKKDMEGLSIDFYYVERDPKTGKNIIRSNGYYYESDDNGDGPFRSLEYVGLYLDPDKLREDPDYYDRCQEAVNQNIEDMTEAKARRQIKEWFSLTKPLPMKFVDGSTPEGWYRDCLYNKRPKGKIMSKLTKKVKL